LSFLSRELLLFCQNDFLDSGNRDHGFNLLWSDLLNNYGLGDFLNYSPKEVRLHLTALGHIEVRDIEAKACPSRALLELRELDAYEIDKERNL